MTRVIILFMASITLTACQSATKIERVVSDGSIIESQLGLYEQKVLVTADLQIHQIYNSINSRTNFINTFSESIRPVVADYLAPEHFQRTLQKFHANNPESPVIILGDVLDVSCDWEFKTFLGLMGNQANWVIAPGNHDFTFLGTHEKSERQSDWESACEQTGIQNNTFNKAEFIFTYIEALGNQSRTPNADPSFLKFSDCLAELRSNRRLVHDCLVKGMKLQKKSKGDVTDRDCAAYIGLGDSWVNCAQASNIPDRLKNMPNQGWWKNDDPKQFLQDIFWYINPADTENSNANQPLYAFSYIIQRVRLPNGKLALLLDTNNPGGIRSVLTYPIFYNPANSANMMYDQMDAASEIMGGTSIWVDRGKTKQDVIKSKDEHVIMTHHPVKDYKFEAKKGLCMLVNVGNVREIYTAHTHSPNSYLHKSIHSRVGFCDGIVEHNVGSMIDFPIEYMVIASKKGHSVAISVELSKDYDEICTKFSGRWEKLSKTEDFYTSYDDLGWFANEEEIQVNLMQSLLSLFDDMLNKEIGFKTISNNWPAGLSSDQDVKAEVDRLRILVPNDGWKEETRNRMLELGQFFNERNVKNQVLLNQFKDCQLHWASVAKDEL